MTTTMTGKEKIAALKISRPDVAIMVLREQDHYTGWVGDGPHPSEAGYVCYEYQVRARTIRNGEIVSGEAYLGGSWWDPDDTSETAEEIGGYLPQLVERALAELDDELAAAARGAASEEVISFGSTFECPTCGSTIRKRPMPKKGGA